MEQTKESPLKKYRRQPKIYIDLPSKGKFWPENAVYNNTFTQMAVFSMTANDDILFKTPDALINGNATANNIKSCVPSILDPWNMPVIDLDTILISIRLATYGPDMTVNAQCPHCKTENSYDVPLQFFIDHYNTLHYNDTCKIDNFKFKTRPLTYKEFTENQKTMLALQRALTITAPTIKDETKRNEFQEKVLYDIADATMKLIIVSIVSVEVDGEVETDAQEIINWMTNTDAKVFKAIKEHTEANVSAWMTPKHSVRCGNDKCGKEHKIAVRLDQSDFFAFG